MTTLYAAAMIAMKDVIGLREGEEVLILTNFEGDVLPIARAVFDASKALGGKPVLVIGPEKTPFDYQERLMTEMAKAVPDVVVELFSNKGGQDPCGLNIGYVGRDGRKYTDVFNRIMRGDRRTRSFWSPGITREIFTRSVPVDYLKMRALAVKLKSVLDTGTTVRVTSPGGTDATVNIRGRKAKVEDGDFTRFGTGGNLPAGEVFISPTIGGVSGTLVIDGTIKLEAASVLPDRPIVVQMKDGYVDEVAGGRTAQELLKMIEKGEQLARDKGLKEEARNARHIGELGIGINPGAKLTGNLLEDEKLLKTVHFAIGSNFDSDARALIHLDGLVLNPDLWVDEEQIMKNGNLLL